jgi:hypothetical protein
MISNMAEQFRVSVNLWTCILEVRGSNFDSISLQVSWIRLFMVLVFPEEIKYS